MNTPIIKKWLAAVLCLLALGSTATLAAPDTFYLGDGHNGALTVSAAQQINTYAQVTADLAVNATTIPVGAAVGAATSIPAGSLIMVLQTTGITPIPASGATAPINLDNSRVGTWELARVASVAGSTLTLTAPLVRAYTALVTQVIVVPEYTTVTVNSAGSIVALPWDGSRGGVVAFLAQNTLTHEGEISASEAGFRGGEFVQDTSGTTGCTDQTGLDQPAPSGAQKGEGIANTRYGVGDTGQGNVANGAGGGICVRSGGGGGAGRGAGGVGGNSATAQPVGGLGGAALSFTAPNRLIFGGGGGAGHGQTAAGQRGGRGAGIVFVRANQLTGAGSFSASGGLSASSTTEAGSGGGGGGTLHLRFATTASCSSLSASGGTGGSTNGSRIGPGGGGGGGYVLFQSAGGTCTANDDSIGGAGPGTQRIASEGSYGATAGSAGSYVVLPGGFVSVVPVIQTPANGAVLNASPAAISGTAEANSSLTLVLTTGTTSTTYGPIPVDASGNWTFTPATPLPDGAYSVTVTTTNTVGDTSPPGTSTFTVDTQAPAAPVIVTPANGTVLNASPSAISGTAEANTTLTLVVDGQSYEVPVDASGNWILTGPTLPTLDNGQYTVTATTRDAAGNVSPSATSTFTINDTIPGAPVIVTPPNGALLDESPPVISGTAEPGSSLTLVINGTEYRSIPVDAAGNWSFTLPTELDDGPYTVTATTTNTAGTTSPTATSTFTVDSTPPDAPVVTGPANGSSVTDSTPVVTGTAEPNTTVTVVIDGVVVGTTPVDDSGNWSYTPTTPLPPGPHSVVARAEDKAGNTSPDSSSNTFTVVPDTTEPETNITTGPEGTTPNRSATFEFDSGEPGVTYECRLDGGEWTPCTSPVTYDNLPDGEHTFEVRARDSEGNVESTPATRTWTVHVGDIDFRGDGLGCSASGGDSSLVLMALGSVLALARRRRQR